MYASCNNNWNRGNFLTTCQAFWILVVIAIILIWIHCGSWSNSWGGWGCGNNCGCDNDCNSCC